MGIARTDFATGSISLDYESTELQAQSGDCGNCPDGPIEDDIAITHSSWQWNNGLSGYGPKGSAKANRARKAVSGMGYKFFLQQVSLTPQHRPRMDGLRGQTLPPAASLWITRARNFKHRAEIVAIVRMGRLKTILRSHIRL